MRNIVHFVNSSNLNNDENLLAEKALENIPFQIEEYCNLKGLI